jgi:hypothetical protein
MYVVVLNKYDGVIGAYLINFLYCVVSFCFPWFCVLYPMLPVSLDYLFLIAASVFTNVSYFYTLVYHRCHKNIDCVFNVHITLPVFVTAF